MHRIELMGDILGAESYIELRAEFEDTRRCAGGDARWKKCRMPVIKKEHPPPLPRLVQTVMKRIYTEDGRLIITEEKAERRRYIRVDRSDERLRLDLVQVPDPFWKEESEGIVDNEILEDHMFESHSVTLVSEETPEGVFPTESLGGFGAGTSTIMVESGSVMDNETIEGHMFEPHSLTVVPEETPMGVFPTESFGGSGAGTVTTIVESASMIKQNGVGTSDSGGNKCSSSFVFGTTIPTLHPVIDLSS